MYKLVEKKWGVDKKNSFMIGDQKTDMIFTGNSKIKGYLFSSGNLYNFIREKITKKSKKMTKNKIVITGGLGLVGKELIRIFSKDNFEIIVIDLRGQLNRSKNFINQYKNNKISFVECDVNSKKLIKITKDCKTVIHLAAMHRVENMKNKVNVGKLMPRNSKCFECL